MVKKGLKWLLLFLSTWFLGDNLKTLLNEFMESYGFIPYYLIMASICATSVYFLARDLVLINRPAVMKPADIKPSSRLEAGKIMTEVDLFVFCSRGLLEKFFATKGTSILLKTGVDYYSCNYWLTCTKIVDGNDYSIKFFLFGGKIEVPFDPKNNDHLVLLDHLWWMLRDYGNSPYTHRDLRKKRDADKVISILKH